MRPDDDLRSIMHVEDAIIKPLKEAKRIDEGPSSTVAFLTWFNDIKIHMTYHGMDSIAYVIVPQARNPPITISDINDHPLTASQSVEWNPFLDWSSVSQEQIVGFDELIRTLDCEVDRKNDTFARKFLSDSVGPVLYSSIDRDLPLNCSGARMLYFIIPKLQVVSATSGRNLVDKIKAMRLTSKPACNAQDFGTKLHNLCIKLEGLGSKYVPDDLPMLVACCYDTTNVASFDLDVIQVQNALGEDPMKLSWQAVIIRLGKKFDTLVGNDCWPPLKSAGKAAETGFPVHLQDSPTTEITKLRAQLARMYETLAATNGHGTPATSMSSDIECNYCHESGHVVATCPKLAAKKAKESGTTAGEDTKHWTKLPPAEGEPLSKTITGDGPQVQYKLCARCRRWRAGEKVHTTDEHRTRAELSMASSQTPNNQANVGRYPTQEILDFLLG
jgi:hypothetical protein